MRIVLVAALLALLALPASADTAPSKQQALDTVTAWRTAIKAVPCDRPNANTPFTCKGDGVKATMPAPVSFGMIGNTHSNDICENNDGEVKWPGKNGGNPIAAGADYDQLTGCLQGMFESNGSAPLTVVSISAASKFLSKPAARQWKALAKTHAFVRMKLQPTEGDPDTHYDVVIAVTLGDDGKPRVVAVFAKLLDDMHEDGE